MEGFDIPVVLFIFKRIKAVEIVERIAKVRPQKLYLMADQGRNEEEMKQAEECRKLVEQAITWDCEVVKDYAEQNRGVYNNIAQGAIRVLRKERWAIFLEDDNLPELTFFPFCKEMLEKYEQDSRILWVCGTNYLGEYSSKHGESYMFTRHMLPCGWASWSGKFERFYDGELSLYNDPAVMERIPKSYLNKALYEQYKERWSAEYRRIAAGKLPRSWDYQMDFSIKAHGLYGICPHRNQIKNIGADELSTHGGTGMNLVMTKRFCGMESYALDFPLHHPKTVLPDQEFDKKLGKIILMPLRLRLFAKTVKVVKRILRIPYDESLSLFLKNRFK
ncbi:MAG: glycosyltransferase family 2 protein [Clostridia bacterium]|nr:glycosyltransferase family 2 protein [Clostridia bacterium]